LGDLSNTGAKADVVEIKHPSFKPVLSRFKILKHISPRRSQITGTACGSWVSDPPADGKGASPCAGSAATAQQGPAQLPAALWSETQLNEEGGGKGSTKTGHSGRTQLAFGAASWNSKCNILPVHTAAGPNTPQLPTFTVKIQHLTL